MRVITALGWWWCIGSLTFWVEASTSSRYRPSLLRDFISLRWLLVWRSYFIVMVVCVAAFAAPYSRFNVRYAITELYCSRVLDGAGSYLVTIALWLSPYNPPSFDDGFVCHARFCFMSHSPHVFCDFCSSAVLLAQTYSCILISVGIGHWFYSYIRYGSVLVFVGQTLSLKKKVIYSMAAIVKWWS